MPDLPAIGSRSSEIVPSGNTAMHSPRAQRLDRGVERVHRVRRAALHRDLVRGAQQRAEPALVEELGFGEEPQAPPARVREVRERERVEVRDVVAREDHRPVARDPVFAFDGPPQPVAQAGVEEALRAGIEGIHGR